VNKKEQPWHYIPISFFLEYVVQAGWCFLQASILNMQILFWPVKHASGDARHNIASAKDAIIRVFQVFDKIRHWPI
jgi:hypothetical protein